MAEYVGSTAVESVKNQIQDKQEKIKTKFQLLVLPKYVAFKGHNNKYLCVRENYLAFSAGDIGDSTAGKFWWADPKWIWVGYDDPRNNDGTTFRPVKVDDKTIGLINLGNENFCTTLTGQNDVEWLSPAIPTITKEAKLTGNIEMSGEFHSDVMWEETKESKTLVDVVHKIVVPAMTKVTVSAMFPSLSCKATLFMMGPLPLLKFKVPLTLVPITTAFTLGLKKQSWSRERSRS
ncbi:hypothetical protein GOBAR_DD22583 [Gossypium barbadense]|nr:hypothetical protein GOBAR_DD22583 [Gossypium barbadense]